ncbi:IS4 family transposase, partial [[Flexibacter] sp. ATCC 35208]|uniref:IS4 family transposase n=1 Tax=[Flexibacter] sp. ATCC 35208 TaxID=1936242 RepID=UPI0015C35AA2
MCFTEKTNKDYRTKVVKHIVKLIDDAQYKNRNKDGEKGFTRNRKLPFKELIVLISRGMMRSIQRELNDFFGKILDQEYSIQQVTKGALSQSRAKLIPEAFKDLNTEAGKTFYEDAPYLSWKGHRLLAADGSTCVLPNHKTTREEFGVHNMGRHADAERCIATTSLMYDVLNLVTLDAIIDKYAVSEQILLRQHLSNVKFLRKDLLLLDRGYPGMSLMYTLQHKQIDYCIRLKGDWWKEGRTMLENGETDKIVTFTLPAKDHHLQKQYRQGSPDIKCRLIVIELETGEQEVLCTSLCNRRKYPYDCFIELYHYRWNIEEAYKLFKCRVGMEVFSGKTARAVRQDFLAKAFMMTMCAILSFPIEEKVRAENKVSSNKYPKQ